jgi:hypothetical protein
MRAGLFLSIYLQMAAQFFNLCQRRLKPAATKSYLIIAARHDKLSAGGPNSALAS